MFFSYTCCFRILLCVFMRVFQYSREQSKTSVTAQEPILASLGMPGLGQCCLCFEISSGCWQGRVAMPVHVGTGDSEWERT